MSPKTPRLPNVKRLFWQQRRLSAQALLSLTSMSTTAPKSKLTKPKPRPPSRPSAPKPRKPGPSSRRVRAVDGCAAPTGSRDAAAAGLAASTAGTAAGAAGLQRVREGMRGGTVASSSGGSGTPFGRATTYDDGSNRRKIMVYAAALAATLVALYVGIAVGDSLQTGGNGGGDDNQAGGLPTRAAGITEANCPGPVNLNQGSKVSLMFTDAPEDYSLEPEPGIRPISPTAAVPQVSAVSQQGNSILFTANTVPNSAGRTDEYRLTATFSKGGTRQQAECTVRVIGPAATPAPATATAPAAPPTSTSVPPTATTAPVIIQPTAVPPTQAPPTATPDLSTPTPSVPTVVPTAGGVLISPTEIPRTATPVPTVASTPTPNRLTLGARTKALLEARLSLNSPS